MRWHPGSGRARRADALEDLAAALDAGLPPSDALAASFPSHTGAAVRDGIAVELGRLLPQLDVASRRALEAAEAAGELPSALRDQASADRSAVALLRDLASRVSYPLFVIGFAATLVAFLALVGLPGLPLPLVLALVATLAGVAGAAVWLWRRARNDPALDLTSWPVIGTVVADAAAIPYLSALRRLHRAGVRVDEAHRLASGTCPLASLRARLVAAAAGVDGHAPLVESLRAVQALDAESLHWLELGERSGGLEDALGRALARRRERVETRTRRLAQTIGSLLYLLAVLLVVALMIGFYGGMLGGAMRLR